VLEGFRHVPLFADLSDEDLARVRGEALEVQLEPGEVLFREGEPGDRAYVVTAGELDVLKAAERRQVLVAVQGEGDVVGEMALVQETPRSATVRARTPARLISITKAALDDLLASSPSAARSVFSTLLRRTREDHDLLRHQERMVQLGTLTAGVAHELNNPAAAVQRAASQLNVELDRLTAAVAGHGVATEALELLRERVQQARTPVEVGDEEDAVEDWLRAHRVDDAWTVAPHLVEAGIGVSELAGLRDDAHLDQTVQLLAAAAAVRRSAAEIGEAASRIAQIVRALHSYSYLDRAPVQEVDVVRGVEDTLALLGHLTSGLRIVREYDADLPTITGVGAELNQVWTNLIRNACDALAAAATPTPTLTLRAGRRDQDVVVEVEDNGVGITPEAQRRVFDAFYTTRPPGEGTGLGLQISYRIIVVEHRGDLTFESEPGRTRFRVALPIHGATTKPLPHVTPPIAPTSRE
jgi:signal transduction histidine kinase